MTRGCLTHQQHQPASSVLPNPSIVATVPSQNRNIHFHVVQQLHQLVDDLVT